MTQLPADLALRLESIFGKSEIKILQSAFKQKKRPVSFRINLLQSTVEEVELALKKAGITYTRFELPENCYVLSPQSGILSPLGEKETTERQTEADLWKLDIYKKGKIYIQSISSQIPVSFFKNYNFILNSFSLQKKEAAISNEIRILDACAAPGGKTSQLAERYPDAEIWAFEPSKIRYEKMIHNFEKLGIESYKTTQSGILSLSKEKGATVYCIHDSIENIGKYITPPNSPLQGEMGLQYFDMILVDAPCSSEGSISLYDTKFLENWDISHIKKNYKRQKRICDSVLPYLKNNGEIIYSTCTLAPEENEAVIHYLLCYYPELSLENIDLYEDKYIKTKEALKSFGKHTYKKEISEHCLRVIPSEYSEGFFIAKLVKKCNELLDDQG